MNKKKKVPNVFKIRYPPDQNAPQIIIDILIIFFFFYSFIFYNIDVVIMVQSNGVYLSSRRSDCTSRLSP